MAKIGRPTKYRPQYCQRIIDLGIEGKMPVALCAELLITKTTLHYWRDNFPEFSDALEISKQACEQYWRELARGRANGNFTTGSDTLIKYYMSACFGIREATDVQQTVTADVTHHGQVEVSFVDIQP